MRPLILSALLLLAPAALAGGTEVRASVGRTPVQPGQLWELQAAPAAAQAFTVRHRIGKALFSTWPDWQGFATSSAQVGGDISFQLSERGLSLTHFVDPKNVSRCFALLPAGARQTEGVLLSGTVEATNDQLRRAQAGTDFSFRALISQARAQGAGRCTLRRLR